MWGLPLKWIIGGVGAIALLISAIAFWNHYTGLKEFKSEVVAETRIAADRPNLSADNVPLQIKYLGQSLDSLRTKIGEQNKGIENLAKEREEALMEAARQAALRKEVIQQSQSLARELRNEALTPVDRDHLEEELRRVQDRAWELGV
jgi:predicted RNase H-like nuclease (RuvC/YqgF family)